jgi:HEAT repeat protein
VRGAGARIIYSDTLENRTVPAGAREALRQLVGDSAAEVRLEAVETLRALNDAQAIDALLTELPQESDPDVRAAIAGTLGPIRDVRAVGALVRCLEDESVKVAESAAESLAAMGPEIRRDGALTDTVTAALRRALEARTTPRNGETTPRGAASGTASAGGAVVGAIDDLRGALIEGLAAMHRRELLGLFQSVLRPSESARVRRAALRGLAELHEPDSAMAIISAMEDTGGGGDAAGTSLSAGVRLEAVNALGAIPTFDHAETLYRRLSPEVEPDPAVRARAWMVLQELFPLATRQRLEEWAERFKEQPERRLGVLRALEKKLGSPGDEEALAVTQQQAGECLMKLEKPADAAKEFREALDYWRSRPAGTGGGGGMYKEGLYQSTIDALLRSRQYPAGAAFAAMAIADSEENQQTMGPRLRSEVQKLIESGDGESAAALIAEIRRMTPPLAQRYREDITGLEARIAQPARGVERSGGAVGGGGATTSVSVTTAPSSRP